MKDSEITQFYDSMIKEIDWKKGLAEFFHRRFFGGFKTFSDYEKYGDMFIPFDEEDSK